MTNHDPLELKLRRIRAGIKAKDIASELGVSHAAVAYCENRGYVSNPRVVQLYKEYLASRGA